MKRMLILAGLAWAMLFLPACSSLDSSTTRLGLPEVSVNWRSDGTYVVNWRSVGSWYEYALLRAEKAGMALNLAADPFPLTEEVSMKLCMGIGMSLQSFNVEKDTFVCVGI